MDITQLEMSTSISIKGAVEILYHAVDIENNDFPYPGRIITTKNFDGISVNIYGLMSIGRIKYTIDDLLKSLNLAVNIEAMIG